MARIGAPDPLPSVPARVGLLNRQPPLGLGDGGYSSCPGPTDHAIWNGGMVTINFSVLEFRRRNLVGGVSSISLADNVRDTFGPYFRGVLAIGWNFAMIASLKRY